MTWVSLCDGHCSRFGTARPTADAIIILLPKLLLPEKRSIRTQLRNAISARSNFGLGFALTHILAKAGEPHRWKIHLWPHCRWFVYPLLMLYSCRLTGRRLNPPKCLFNWRAKPRCSKHLVAVLERAVNTLPSAWLLQPTTGEVFDSIEHCRRRLQGYALAEGFDVVQTGGGTKKVPWGAFRVLEARGVH